MEEAMSVQAPNGIEDILEAAFYEGVLTDASPWAVFYDLDRLETRFDAIRKAFPEGTLHAVAIKANPLRSLLKKLVEAGAGLEAASFGEVELAMGSGCPPERIVFDSPAKTRSELRKALELGVLINADNLDELARIAELLNGAMPASPVGLRMNPAVGLGTIAMTSVATLDSKFGVLLEGHEQAVLDAFQRYPWLTGLHVHSGSQGMGLGQLVEGVARVVALAGRIDAAMGKGRVGWLDVGGGVAFGYRPEQTTPTMADYVEALEAEVPELFAPHRRIVTEFGRWLHAPCGFAASRVEYVKQGGTATIVTIHFGADLLLRRAYRPDQWPQQVTLHGSRGGLLETETRPTTVAGPLCFSGDVIVERELLPSCKEGDIAVAHDVGAYTFAMWSRYCSRAFPRIFGYRRDDGRVAFTELHRGDSTQTVMDQWS
jgi:diaminopimelate decarboxylase